MDPLTSARERSDAVPPGTPSAADGALIVLDQVAKTYGEGAHAVEALRDVSLEIARGEFVVLLGPSGSGKTTLLNVVGGIEPPSRGSVTVDGERVDALDEGARTGFRRRHVGVVFQFFNLIPTLTADENVQLIAELRPELGDAAERSARALADVGLAERAHHYPAQLSGGEQQRVATARAIVNRPAILLCDEPTGSLDLDTGRSILSLLRRTGQAESQTTLLVTHNSAIAQMADRVLRMQSGRIVGDEHVAAPLAAEEISW